MFTIWQANPTKEENLVPVGSQSTCHQTISNHTTSGGTNAASEASSWTLSIAAISVITIGIVLAMGMIVIMICYLRRRRLRMSDATRHGAIEKRRSLVYDTYKEMTTATDAANSYDGLTRAIPHEMPTYGHNPAQELVGWEAPAYEMPGTRWSSITQAAQSARADLAGKSLSDTRKEVKT